MGVMRSTCTAMADNHLRLYDSPPSSEGNVFRCPRMGLVVGAGTLSASERMAAGEMGAPEKQSTLMGPASPRQKLKAAFEEARNEICFSGYRSRRVEAIPRW